MAEKIDHRAEAELAVAQAGEYFGDEADLTTLAAAAIGLTHSNLLIAEELRGIREALQGVVTASPSGVGSLRVREQSR